MDEGYYDVAQSIPSSLHEITIAHLLDPAFNPDQVLWELSSEQLELIEKTLMKVKKQRTDILKYTKDGRITKLATTQVKLDVPLVTDLASQKATQNNAVLKEPTTFMRDGIEWVSFFYSHNRRLQKYEIRTDVEKVDLEKLEPKFQQENCVYPRAFCNKEEYKGNRWSYETECNQLGWKLAYLNPEQISGKRGLIQRAVDSYRNRYPGLRSRRVTRQEKIMNGTLRRRKPRGSSSNVDCSASCTSSSSSGSPQTIPDTDTLVYQDIFTGKSWVVRININDVDISEIDNAFKQKNSVFPRSAFASKDQYEEAHRADEVIFNEIAWKLAWLNPQLLAGKKGALQRVLDLYRSKYTVQLKPRPRKIKSEAIPLSSSNTHSAPDLPGLLQTTLPPTESTMVTTNTISASIPSFDDLFFAPTHPIDYIMTNPTSVTTSSPTHQGAQPCLTAEQLLNQLMK
ncbi:hypothetical protein K493DRAFT_306134 [Basidiobolus meristosporus CBS 931.73]|uniref:DUF8032 domain-containing protein n=1 Tax=Basidiobolus meristosporus CBS 931.73 TaxID=1314790 RepID=A0A1Y1XTD6_9FUNG|nr:hypothetical protein K493DRAFT_306134 [Basidiobolus meristosporus CBS 931.73]|eukprot:ORX89012.1 hypothetical protein K493DRAFT_306134 [Basidiobolus meristosporus CBS 931.73]